MTARSGWLAPAILLLLPAFPAAALTLGFGSLPSAQGWTFSSNPGVVEGDVYSVDGTTLTLDTIGLGEARASYGQNGVVPTVPFSILLRARVLQDEALREGAKGFFFSAFTGSELFSLSLDTDSISVGGVDTPFDGTQFHDFRMDVTPGVGFDFFVDGAFFASGTGAPSSVRNVFGFGDGNSVPADEANTLAEITRLELIPEPATALLLTCGLVALGVRRRRH